VRLARSFLSLVPRGASVRERDDGRDYLVRGRVRLRVYEADDGHPDWAMSFDGTGRSHGRERHWFPDGRLMYDAGWTHGVQHGLQRQWDHRGNLIVRTRFVRGTGVDIWCDPGTGRLTETREMRDGHRHGYERWWSTARTLWSERHFDRGREHGVFRSWRGARLSRGTRFFVAGEQVSRRAYAQACRTDAALPPLDARLDQPTRRAPSRLRDQ
jgi:hypothetical protein